MTFDMVEGANRIAAVIAIATVPRVGEEDIIVLVVANPLATALGPHEPATFAAQPAAWGVRLRCFRLAGVGLSDGWFLHNVALKTLSLLAGSRASSQTRDEAAATARGLRTGW